MSENALELQAQTPGPAPAAKPAKNPEQWRTMIIVLTMINTILVAVFAGLQTDANIRANNANRDSQYYAVLTSAELQRIGAMQDYDINTYARVLDNTQRSLVNGFTALQLIEAGDEQGAGLANVDGTIYQAQADTAVKFSVFFQDPRYAPPSPDSAPDMQAYLDDSNKAAYEFLAKQNTASDDYKIWSTKSDSYVAALTVLAIAFFLFGIAQSVNPRLRLLFAGFGIIVIMLGVGWGLAILVA